jgi:hypothetical protein
MSWQEAVAVLVICAGLGAGAFLAAQRPGFWIEFGSRLLKAVAPAIWGYISKPESPEVRKARQRCERMGGQWDHFRKRCRDR